MAGARAGGMAADLQMVARMSEPDPVTSELELWRDACCWRLFRKSKLAKRLLVALTLRRQ